MQQLLFLLLRLRRLQGIRLLNPLWRILLVLLIRWAKQSLQRLRQLQKLPLLNPQWRILLVNLNICAIQRLQRLRQLQEIRLFLWLQQLPNLLKIVQQLLLLQRRVQALSWLL